MAESKPEDDASSRIETKQDPIGLQPSRKKSQSKLFQMISTNFANFLVPFSIKRL